jgi:hypothetical protein
MKTIGRILIILAVAALVSGAFWALTGGTNASAGAFPANREFGELRERSDGSPEGGFRPDHERGEESFGALSILGMLKSIIPISVIVLVVVLVERFMNGRRLAQKMTPANQQSSSPN